MRAQGFQDLPNWPEVRSRKDPIGVVRFVDDDRNNHRADRLIGRLANHPADGLDDVHHRALGVDECHAVGQPPRQAPQDTRSWLRRILPGPPARFNVTEGPKDRSGERQVWVLGANGQPAAVPVTVGASDGSRTVVRKGALKAGDRLVTDSVQAKT